MCFRDGRQFPSKVRRMLPDIALHSQRKASGYNGGDCSGVDAR